MVAANGADKRRERALHWRRRIIEQRDSGLSVDAWCRVNDVGKQSFYLWRRRLAAGDAMRDGAAGRADSSPHASVLRRGPLRAGNGALEPMSLARVLVGPSRAAGDDGQTLRLRLSGGDELLLPASMPVKQLAELIAALERRAAYAGGDGLVGEERI